MNTIDVTTITAVKYLDSLQQGYSSQSPISIKPDTSSNLYSDLENLFRARWVKTEGKWVDLQDLNNPLPFSSKNLTHDGTEANPNAASSDAVADMQAWGFYFPEGVYLYDDIAVGQKTYILGSGAKTVFKSFKVDELFQSGNVSQNDYDNILPILINPIDGNLESLLIENVTFQDCKRMELEGKDITIRNCRFFNNIKGSIGAFHNTSHLLVENCYSGFDPNPPLDQNQNPINGYYSFNISQGALDRDDTLACSEHALSITYEGDKGCSEIVIQNNYFENSEKDEIFIQGDSPGDDLNLDKSGISNVNICNNKFVKAGKSAINLSVQNGLDRRIMPFGQVGFLISNNHIREWGLKFMDSAIACDNWAYYSDADVDFIVPTYDSEEYLNGIPLQEFIFPLTLPSEESGGEGATLPGEPSENPGVQPATPENDDPIPHRNVRYSYSSGLTISGNNILGSGRLNGRSDFNEAYGITVLKWKNLNIDSNNISGVSIYDVNLFHFPSGSTVRSGIQIQDCTDFTICSNTIVNTCYLEIFDNLGSYQNTNNERGAIKMINCKFGAINSNVIKNAGALMNIDSDTEYHLSQGIILWNSRFCLVQGNTISCYNPLHLIYNHIPVILNAIYFTTTNWAVIEMGNDNVTSLRCAENKIGHNKVFNLNQALPAYSIVEDSMFNAGTDVYYGTLTETEIV